MNGVRLAAAGKSAATAMTYTVRAWDLNPDAIAEHAHVGSEGPRWLQDYARVLVHAAKKASRSMSDVRFVVGQGEDLHAASAGSKPRREVQDGIVEGADLVLAPCGAEGVAHFHLVVVQQQAHTHVVGLLGHRLPEEVRVVASLVPNELHSTPDGFGSKQVSVYFSVVLGGGSRSGCVEGGHHGEVV
eukprot:scaffold1533_cov111-Isochrysis_galbana.AAC.5